MKEYVLIGHCRLGWCLLNENYEQISDWYESETELIENEIMQNT